MALVWFVVLGMLSSWVSRTSVALTAVLKVNKVAAMPRVVLRIGVVMVVAIVAVSRTVVWVGVVVVEAARVVVATSVLVLVDSVAVVVVPDRLRLLVVELFFLFCHRLRAVL